MSGRPSQQRAERMFYPVRCGLCGGIYDGGKVEVLQRYADCSVWKAPCCGATVDDRPWVRQAIPITQEEVTRSAFFPF